LRGQQQYGEEGADDEAGWVSDPVHPNDHIYAKTALNLIEKVAVAASPQHAGGG
jgi:hypothetical protein